MNSSAKSVEQQSYQDILENLYRRLSHQSETYIGYPNNKALSNTNLAPFLDLAINNVGDPFIGNNGLNTSELEVELLEFFADLFHLKKDEFWGYVTNGGTEGNLYGLYLGRLTYPDGIVVHSRDSHYSVPKSAKLLGLKSLEIQSQRSGEIDYDHLKSVLISLKQYPIIWNANIGTTMTGAIDNIQKVLNIFQDEGITQFYIHCDAALFGPMLALMPGSPVFDFRLPIGSLSISGHKFLGSPIPSGMVFTKKNQLSKVGDKIEYIRSNDTTISGSRDGFTVLVLWQQLKRLGREGLISLMNSCMKMTDFTLSQLASIDWPAWKNSYSNIVVIKRPSELLIRKWQLATHHDWSHIVLMPGVTEEQVCSFINDLKGELK